MQNNATEHNKKYKLTNSLMINDSATECNELQHTACHKAMQHNTTTHDRVATQQHKNMELKQTYNQTQTTQKSTLT